MKLNALLASLVVAGAGFAVPALAANTIGTVTTVSDEDWPYVVEYCEDLDGLTPTEAFEKQPSRYAELVTTTIQLSSITQSDCERAGLI